MCYFVEEEVRALEIGFEVAYNGRSDAWRCVVLMSTHAHQSIYQSAATLENI